MAHNSFLLSLKTFTKQWGITHTTSSPAHHQSNGKAEAAFKTIKIMMKKSSQENPDQCEALLELRNTPRQDTCIIPHEMMFGRRTRSLLPVRRISKPACTRQAIKKKSKRRLIVKWTYDKGARDLPQLTTGQSVYHQHTEKKNCDWRRGRIRAKHTVKNHMSLKERMVCTEETEYTYSPRQ